MICRAPANEALARVQAELDGETAAAVMAAACADTGVRTARARLCQVDVPTVLASAALSAVVSAVVALSLTIYRAGREARAARRVRAREAIESEARTMRTDLRTYRAGFAASPRRDAAVSWMDDYVKASAILHRAYAEPSGHKLQARLDRHLALLARAL